MLVAGRSAGLTFSFVFGCSAQAREDRLHLRARLVDRAAVGQPPLDEQPALAALRDARVARLVLVLRALDAREVQLVDHHQRHPEVGLDTGEGADKVARSHPHDRVGESRDLERRAEHVGAAREAALPEPVAEHQHGVPARGRVLLRQEAAAERGTHAEEVEVVRGDDFPGGERGLARAPAQDAACVRVGAEVRERRGRLADREEIGVRAGEVRHLVGEAGVDLDQAVRPLDRGAAEEHGVHHAEQRGVQADPQRQRGDGGGREGRTARELPDAVLQVPDEVLHAHLLEASKAGPTVSNVRAGRGVRQIRAPRPVGCCGRPTA
jgi:hypothetical protein